MATKTVEILGSTPQKMEPTIKALQLLQWGGWLFCWLWLLAPYYELLYFLPYFLGHGYPHFPLLPLPPLDWAGPAPVLPSFCCTGLQLWDRKLPLYISCQGVPAF